MQHPNLSIITKERDSRAVISIQTFLSRWHKEGIQSHTLSHWCTIQPPGFISWCGGTGGAEDGLRDCAEKESSGLYRGKVFSDGGTIVWWMSLKLASFYFPRWKTTQTRSAGCWRRFPALQTPRMVSAPSRSSWTTSSTPAVAFCATRRFSGRVTSAQEGPAPPRWEVGEASMESVDANQFKICLNNSLSTPTGVCRHAQPQARTEGFRCWLWHRWRRLLHGKGRSRGYS